MSDKRDWTLIIVAVTQSGHVAIHEMLLYSMIEEAAKNVADNLTKNNPYATIGVTLIGVWGDDQ